MGVKTKRRRRPPIPGGQTQRDRKNDYSRKAKHPKRDNQPEQRGFYLPLSW
jgi:hypothetical protein